jgi:hypothetical protein
LEPSFSGLQRLQQGIQAAALPTGTNEKERLGGLFLQKLLQAGHKPNGMNSVLRDTQLPRF